MSPPSRSGGIVCIAASNGGTTSQDLKTGFLIGATPRSQQIAILCGAFASALVLGPILLALNDASTVYVPLTGVHAEAAAPSWRVPPATLPGLAEDRLKGPAGTGRLRPSTACGRRPTRSAARPGAIWSTPPARRSIWSIPGINGTHRTRPDGTTVNKFAAPKATLMSYIIKGILSRQLPWTLVILGVMIAVVLEMCGIASLAFAVGVYLPLSSSAPIFIGGAVRWLVDRHLGAQVQGRQSHTRTSSSPKPTRAPACWWPRATSPAAPSPASASPFMAGALTGFDQRVTDWMTAHNPFFSGPWSDILALLPFGALVAGLYLAGRLARSAELAGPGDLVKH